VGRFAHEGGETPGPFVRRGPVGQRAQNLESGFKWAQAPHPTFNNFATVNICLTDLPGDQRSNNLGLALYEGL